MNQFPNNVISLLLLLVCLSAIGQDDKIERKTYETAFTPKAPTIDGYLNDSCWTKVEWAGDFIQSQPYENKPPSQQTAFKILYDNDNLYVFIRAYDTEPDKISRRISRRDNFDGDMVEINIDSYYDKQTAFSFTAMASGAKGEEAVTKDGNNWDSSWNPVWFMKTSIDDQGWCAEMRIPLSQLRFGNKAEHIWGLQVMRHIFRLEERSNWQFIPKGSPGMVHLFGELHGIQGIHPKRQLELMPYTLAKIERFEKEESNPFLDGKDNSFSAGLDGKAAITNDLTLDFTINPDFGQVEADPSEVNLSAFESYFSERRPFFVEGKNIFEFRPTSTNVIQNMGSDNLFYSRRIGRAPHYSPDLDDNEYIDMPEATTILGALKLSGKTKNGLSIGIMESLTANEKATIDKTGVRSKESVEPLTNYFVGRVQQDFNKGESTLGGIITAVNRDIDNPALNFLPTAAYTGGIDFSHSWKERTWYLKGNAEFSYVKGDPEAILDLQQSSARYFQRPDAPHLSLDSTRTSLAGYGATVRFGRTSKQRIQFETSFTLRSPRLDFNDIGFMRYSDVIHHGSWMGYYLREPFSIFNNFYLNTNYWMYWDFSGELLSSFLNTNFNLQFKNRWRLNGSCSRINENTSTNLLRGGPSFRMPGGAELYLNASSDQSKKIAFYLGTYHNWGDANSYNYHKYWTGIEARPTNALSVSLEPGFILNNKILQYVETCDLYEDQRYLFASINQKTALFTFRLNYTFTPELSLEYYGQPFVSAGKYTDYKRITAPHANQFADRFKLFTENEISYDSENNSYTFDENGDRISDYSLDNPDFNFRQFRSNFVVRWEYKPGSTLFFVWSQGRTDSTSNGSFDYGHDMRELFDLKPHNVFLVKFSYWFSL